MHCYEQLRTLTDVQFAVGDLLSWLILGGLAGWLASVMMRGHGYGCLGNIVVGLIGAVVGGFLASLLNINGSFHFWGSLLIAFLGACGSQTSSSPSPVTAPPATQPTAEKPGQSMPCPDNVCADGLTCVSYYGIAGPQGPKFSSCEVPCATEGATCPDGQTCITIADGPGRVCRQAIRLQAK